jgi:uncharacterized protein (DUF58 family)
LNSQSLKSILIKAKKLSHSSSFGIHNSSHIGDGIEFSEIREYEMGDDIKYIDSLQSAKHQKPMIKLFQRTTELDIIIVGFISGSLYFGTDEFKNEKLAFLASTFGFLAYNNGDSFSSFLGSDKLELCTKRSKHFFTISQMSKGFLETPCLEKEIDYKSIITKLNSITKPNSIIILIGDFLDIGDIDLSPLKQKDTRVCIIRDRFEENPDISGNINLIDNTKPIYLYSNISPTQTQNYKDAIKENDYKFFLHLNKLGIKYAKFYTNENDNKPLCELLR